MSTEVLSDFTMKGCTYSNSLMVCTAIPDESMQIQALQDPSRSIAETAYAKDMQARLQAGIEKAMTVMPQLELAFVASWQRMSELVEIGDAEGAASAMLADIGRQMSLPFGQAIAKIKLQFPAGVEIALGSARTEEPRPGQAGLMAMYEADGGNMVRSSFAALLTGTPLSAVADALKLHLTELGLSASFVALEPRKPVQRLDYIAIGPEDALGTEGDNELRVAYALEARGITPHWRRGFYRTQHHGVGRTLSFDVLPDLKDGDSYRVIGARRALQ